MNQASFDADVADYDDEPDGSANEALVKAEIEGKIMGEAMGAIKDAASMSKEAAAAWGDPINTAGATEERHFVQKVWSASQPTLGAHSTQ